MTTSVDVNSSFEASVRKIQRRLQHLDDKDVSKITSAAVSASMTPVAREQRKEAPDNKRNKRKEHKLKKAIGRKKKTLKRRLVAAKVGGNVGPAGKGTKRAPHFHLNALGTSVRRNKRGQNRGRMKANDFVARGTRRAGPEAIRRMEAKAVEKGRALVQEAKTK